MTMSAEISEKERALEEFRSKINSLLLRLEFGGIKLYLYVKPRVFRTFWMSLDVPKGLGAGLLHRMIFWAPKTEVPRFWNAVCVCMHDSCVRMLPQKTLISSTHLAHL